MTLQNKAHKNSNFRQAEVFFPPLFVIILLDCHVCNAEPSWRLLPGGRKQSKEKLLKRQSQTPDVKASENHKVNKTRNEIKTRGWCRVRGEVHFLDVRKMLTLFTF